MNSYKEFQCRTIGLQWQYSFVYLNFDEMVDLYLVFQVCMDTQTHMYNIMWWYVDRLECVKEITKFSFSRSSLLHSPIFLLFKFIFVSLTCELVLDNLNLLKLCKWYSSVLFLIPSPIAPARPQAPNKIVFSEPSHIWQDL